MPKMFMFVHTAINPGATEAFTGIASEAITVAKEKPGSLTGYEWFLSPNKQNCTVIEIYDSPEIHAAHVQRVVLPHASKLRQHGSSEIGLAGNVAAAMLEQMRARNNGRLDYFGPRIFGKLDAPAPTTRPKGAGARAFVLSRYELTSCPPQEFPKVADAAFKKAKPEDPDVLAFEWFFEEPSGRGLVLEVLSDEQVFNRRLDSTVETISMLLTVAHVDTQILGAIPEPLQRRLQTEVGARFGGSQMDGIL